MTMPNEQIFSPKPARPRGPERRGPIIDQDGNNIRYGIDGIIGLIPVVGDIIATALSLWLVREARALGAPWHVTARMLGNVAVQGVIGAVPVAGDAFDVLFRANMRNVRLLRRWLDRQR